MKKKQFDTILALECGIDGGSISLIKNGTAVFSQSGSSGISKSEDVLFLIETTLQESKIKKSELDAVVVSDYPGSLTGLRIGVAIAKGLADSLNIELITLSLLESVVESLNVTGRCFVGIKTSKNQIFVSEYIRDRKGSLRLIRQSIDFSDLKNIIEASNGSVDNSYIFNLELLNELSLNDVELNDAAIFLEGIYSEYLGNSLISGYLNK